MSATDGLRDPGCPACKQLTSGDCGKHGSVIVPFTGAHNPVVPLGCDERQPSAWSEFGDGHDYSRTGKHDPLFCRGCLAEALTAERARVQELQTLLDETIAETKQSPFGAPGSARWKLSRWLLDRHGETMAAMIAKDEAIARLTEALEKIKEMTGSHTVMVPDIHPAGWSAIYKCAERALVDSRPPTEAEK